jgi:uncharacterized membrane protein
MFQTHCYDAWLGGNARDSRFAMWSHLGGTFPAPLFLFLAGISVALIVDRMLQKGASPSQVGKKVIFRGAEILGLGFLFRLQEYAISWGWAPWSDLFRVDVLNVIGISIMLMGASGWIVLLRSKVMSHASEGRHSISPLPSSVESADGGTKGTLAAQRRDLSSPARECGEGEAGAAESASADGTSSVRASSTSPVQSLAPQGRPSLAQARPEASRRDVSPGTTAKGAASPGRTTESPYSLVIAASISATIVISSLTPLLWTTWRPRFLPWELESYINGVHNLGTPQPWLFPIFPWTGFAFAGLAMGFVLTSSFRKTGGWLFLFTGIFGLALVYAAKLADSLRWQIYPVYDYWHTSPAFFATRVGLLLMLLFAAYVWCRWGLGQIGFSPLVQLGKTSLLVYWVHIELVYGRFHILPPHSQTILGASKGLLTIFLSMLVLSLARTMWKERMAGLFSWRKLSRASSHA